MRRLISQSQKLHQLKSYLNINENTTNSEFNGRVQSGETHEDTVLLIEKTHSASIIICSKYKNETYDNNLSTIINYCSTNPKVNEISQIVLSRIEFISYSMLI